MQYKVLTINKINFLEARNKTGLRMIFSPAGASVRGIYFDDTSMVVTPAETKDFLNHEFEFGKTLGPIVNFQDSTIININNKDYKGDTKFFSPHLLYSSKSCMDPNIFSIMFSFAKRKFKDGLPGNVNQYVSYSMSDSGDSFLIDYRAQTSDDTPMTLSNDLCFNLGSENIDELFVSVPSQISHQNIVSNQKYQLIDKDSPIILENNKYKLEVLSNYENVEIRIGEYEGRKGICIVPLDNNSIIKKGDFYHRHILYKITKI